MPMFLTGNLLSNLKKIKTMKNDKMNQLSHVHLLQRLWKSELETVQIEIDYFLSVINDLRKHQNVSEGTKVDLLSFNDQFYHYKRLINNVLTEIKQVDSELAYGVLNDDILNTESKRDHQYLKGEMDYFDYDYHQVKKDFKEFIKDSKILQ
jgi:hypothetical protein